MENSLAHWLPGGLGAALVTAGSVSCVSARLPLSRGERRCGSAVAPSAPTSGSPGILSPTPDSADKVVIAPALPLDSARPCA